MKYGLLFSLFLILFPLNQDKKNFSKLSVLQGLWVREKNGTQLYESWQKQSEEQLQGKSYKLNGADTVFLEKMSLNRKNRQIVFSALTMDDKDQGVTAFFLTRVEKNQFFFENPTHDFPKRVIYELISQDSLHAWIDGGESIMKDRIDFYFRRVKN